MENFSDEELVSLCRKGKEEALAVLVKRYMRPLYALARQFTGDEDRAADVTQEALVKAWRNLKKFDAKKKFRPWIFAIARNTALDWLRKREDIAFSSFADGDEGNMLENIADCVPLQPVLLEQKISAEEIESAIEKLPEHYRSVVSLRARVGLSFREIAENLGEPLNTVKSRWRRAAKLIGETIKNSDMA